MAKRGIWFVLLVLLHFGCMEEDPNTLFKLLPAQQTNIHFKNTLVENTRFNIIDYLYFYNGGGVASGDINNDGLVDLYFVSNQSENKLYLNKGNLEFEDITDVAGVGGHGDWSTGATMADVNGDGWLDIYLCFVVGHNDYKGKNQLFINNGNNTFTESAAAFGLDIQSYGTQAAFFDYDNDNDLDMYLLNHSVHNKGTYGPSDARYSIDKDAGDRLFRNDGNRFTDVTIESGIYSSKLGYGLDITPSDINNDGYIDLYISNDFHENDYLYMNNGDGTFKEMLEQMMPHTSRFSMGNDIADINNDGLQDVVVLDMLPENEKILKTSEGAESWDIYDLKISYGYHHQVSRNTLQMNAGNDRFSEQAIISGVYATDWSWTSLFADYNLDGKKDLYITNGILRRPNDSDFVKYISNEQVQNSLEDGVDVNDMNLVIKMPTVELSNFMYENTERHNEQRFENVTVPWGLAETAYSNGATYADLDNDGDLDLVVNNINKKAFVYENRSDTLTKNHFLKLTYKGRGNNPFGVGAKSTIYTKEGLQVVENIHSRGMLSASTGPLVIGLGDLTRVDSIVTRWPDGFQQVLVAPAIDRELVLDPAEWKDDKLATTPALLNEAEAYGLDFVHKENKYIDFDVEFLLPHKLSTQGPACAVGDINGDGLDDVFIGGAAGQRSETFVQTANGFKRLYQEDLAFDDFHEDVDATLFDADNDGDLDLYVVRGGGEVQVREDFYHDKLYLNDGKGNMRSSSWAPPMKINGGTVAASDFDGDGLVDLFVGGRSIPGSYGLDPQSVLLKNNGQGFEDVTLLVGGELAHLGMITDAVWMDYDGDNDKDLFIVGEWMPLQVFENLGGILANRTKEAGTLATGGWWNCLEVVDMNQDGQMDLVAGNLGMNALIWASEEEPAQLTVSDFDGNGSTDPFISYFKNGVHVPIITRDELVRQIAIMKKEYPTYDAFGKVTMDNLFDDQAMKAAITKKAQTFASSVFINQGNKSFVRLALPYNSQLAPMFGAMVFKNANGETNLLTGGNFFASKPYFGRYDASTGDWVKMENGSMNSRKSIKTGLFLQNEVRRLHNLTIKNDAFVLVVNNNAPLELYKLNYDENSEE